MKTRITYDQLEKVLLRLGYTADTQGRDRFVFRHPNTELPVIMRQMRRREVLKPIDLLSVQNALANGGIVPKEGFDALFQPTMFYIKNKLDQHIFFYKDPRKDGYEGEVREVSLTLPGEDFFDWPDGAKRPMVCLGASADRERYVVFRSENECR